MEFTRKTATTQGIKDSYVFSTIDQLLTDGTAKFTFKTDTTFQYLYPYKKVWDSQDQLQI